jgi:hypothetical protein
MQVPKPERKRRKAEPVTKIRLQDKKECFVTHSTASLTRHHIFYGPLRKKSEKFGLVVWLRADWHNTSNYGVHFNPALDKYLKKIAQKAFEGVYGHEKFMTEFGRNYL